MTSTVFLKNLLAFFQKTKTHPVSTNAFVLWHYLLYSFYKTNAEPLNLHDISIKPYTGLKPEEINSAIIELEDHNFISHSIKEDTKQIMHHFEFVDISYDYTNN